MEPSSEVYANISELCGVHDWVVWNNRTNDFGQCFFALAVVSPAHALLAIASSYYIGLQSAPYYLRTTTQKWVLYARGLAVLVLALAPIACIIVLSALHANVLAYEGIAFFIEASVEAFAWMLHFIYVKVLLERITPSIRGKRGALCLFVMVGIVECLRCKTLMTREEPFEKLRTVTQIHAIVRLVCLATYFLTLIPAGDDSESQYEELLTNERLSERSPLSRSFTQDYLGFREEYDPNYLGVAKEGSNWLATLFLYWVNPLISKGQKTLLKTSDDVFDVPVNLGTPVNSEQFQQMHSDPRNKSVLKILYSLYGKEFFLIGILKFVADCAGFCSPVLLNLVVKFMEDKSDDIRFGYLYAIGLAVSTFTVAMCNTHFNLMISELKLKVRAAIVTAVYKHVVGVSSVELNKFNTGEVLNYMSTDTDRVVNFGPSLHAVWSLPFQLIVTIALLYDQLGISSLTGVGVTILMIPLNKIVADKIGSLSTKMMKAKDDRVQSMAELLSGIRVVKYMGWEPYFAQRIHAARREELKFLRGRKYLDAICVYLWATTPVLISVLTFATYVLIGNTLSAAKVFTSVALFAMLTGPLNAFPWALNGLVEAFVSIKRISEFLTLSRVDLEKFYSPISEIVDEEVMDDTVIAVSKGIFTHKAESVLREGDFRLDQVSFSVKKGELVGVIGKVGSGKSSLLSSILGEMTRVHGKIAVNTPFSGIGYVKQEPWLQQGTIKDNILFGKNYQQEWYDAVVEACALKDDLASFAKGDLTNVGEHGVMLSGGQKARVALARAVYQDKEVYLIDDIFSALDVPVATQVFKKCITGILRQKTRILCTHHPRFLGTANEILVMEGGKITDRGTPSKVLPKLNLEFQGDESESRSLTKRRKSMADVEERQIRRRLSMSSSGEEEARESGVINLNVYKAYWHAVGNMLSSSILFSLVMMQASRNYTDVYLAQWVSHDEKHKGNATKVTHYLTVYGSIAVVNSVFSCLRAFLFAYGGVCAANIIHERLLGSILKAKTWFFDTTPMGRILNRFSSDLYTVDDSLPFILNILLAQIVGVIGPVIVCAYAVPWIILVLVPLTFILYDVQLRYRPASRDLKRIGSVSLSPIYAHFSDTLSGLQTIRAMKATRRFVSENEDNIESNQKAQYAGVAAAQWLELRLQLLGCGVVTAIAVISVIQHHTGAISPGLVGLAISYALGITGKLSGLVSAFTETEREFVAVERCKQYIDDVQTEDFDGGVTTTPYNWPSEGIIVFKEVSFKYHENLPNALQDLSFETKGREKVGVVGRTGSGKSSIFQVLFRTTEVVKGEVTIDGVNIRLLNLSELRSHLSIIPQDPFLFKGTIRENLDPLGRCSDVQLWDALRKSHLASVIDRLGGLDGLLEEHGRSLSVGQRQLLCVARAILTSAKVVCVDEATANVDLETDKHVQDVLRTALHNCTVITIAHRVETVMGSDRVIVMASGKAIEVGHPNILLQDPGSKFSQHVCNNR